MRLPLADDENDGSALVNRTSLRRLARFSCCRSAVAQQWEHQVLRQMYDANGDFGVDDRSGLSESPAVRVRHLGMAVFSRSMSSINDAPTLRGLAVPKPM
jgi:hypothetical protein